MPLLRHRRTAGTVGSAAVTALLVLVGAHGAAAAPPEPREVVGQRAVADRLAGEVADAENRDEQARDRLDELAAAAGAALETYQAAEKARYEAEADHWTQSERLDHAQRSAAASRGELGRWAAEAYREGPAAGAWGLSSFLDARSTDDLGQRLALLSVVARAQRDVVDELEAVAGAQATAAAQARATALAVSETTARAAAAKEASERLVAEQRQHVLAAEAELAQTRDAAATAEQRAEYLAAARALADRQASEATQARLAARGGSTSRGGARQQLTGRVPAGACQGQDVSWFPNGEIPAEALCSMWGAPGHLLRADAAAAFGALATAWAQDHGTPLCVTDSYRPIDDQVRLFSTKPHLAARPGTSNHGWGVALDLCGGIQTFGTAQHRWMQRNAPLFGWFHPGWAQQGGTKPEAWHWEYGG